MKIKKITLNNYKVYKGKNIFDIPQDKKIIIVKGNNGSGKTTLIYSIIWCLYDTGIKDKVTNIFNKDLLFELKTGDVLESYVSINFSHENENYYIKRQLKYIKKENDKENEIERNTEETFLLEIINKSGIKETIKDSIEIRNKINSMINESIKEYFFFDATKIKDFMHESHEEDVKIAIKNLLNIKTIERAMDHLKTLDTEQTRNNLKSEKISQELKEKYNEKIKTEEKLDEIEKKIKKKQEEKNDSLNQKNLLEKEISNTKAYEELIEKIEIEENNRKILEEELDEIVYGKITYLKKSYIVYSNKLVSDSKIIFDKEKKELNKRELTKILKLALDNKKCLICDNELDEIEKNKIQQKYFQLTSESINENEIVEDYYRESQELKNELKFITKELPKILIQENNKKQEKELIESRIEILKKEKSKFAEGNSSLEYRITLKHLEGLIEELENSIDLLKKEKWKQEENLKEIELDIEKMEKKSNVNILEKKKYKVLKELKKELENIYNTYENRKIKDINKNIFLIFKKLIEKKAFTNVFIDSNYKLNINLNEREENVLNQISDGEKVILSLSLIMSLALSSNSPRLFMMDTPFEKLDTLHSQKVIGEIPSLVDQLFLIVTDSQVDDQMLERCENEIAAKFILKQDETGASTSIERE
ncbi:AAA family ATPase [Cetobacterium somerae]|uniref:AAA family ATPase n=1 Tax=Cetobacterium somerae TaxID=188913 RepID=UPI00224FFA94|nr:AAA family ATPase [Cetobacterium somerae]MCX3068445.1 AAA family ATPase [Cetobacterium somerae]